MRANINLCAYFGETPKAKVSYYMTTGKCEWAVILSLNCTVGLKDGRQNLEDNER